jgi:hypothetical protein
VFAAGGSSGENSNRHWPASVFYWTRIKKETEGSRHRLFLVLAPKAVWLCTVTADRSESNLLLCWTEATFYLLTFHIERKDLDPIRGIVCYPILTYFSGLPIANLTGSSAHSAQCMYTFIYVRISFQDIKRHLRSPQIISKLPQILTAICITNRKWESTQEPEVRSGSC